MSDVVEPLGAGRIEGRELEQEMRSSFIDYAMSVIVARALPDVRDGLKPVHRRVLYAMHEAGLPAEPADVKCARVVGDVMGYYHPHGDSARSTTPSRGMAQPFSLRYPLVDGQGNFGNIDDYPPAADALHGVPAHALATEMLRDIDMDTVDFGPNYDESRREPQVLPSRFPNLLVNGSPGIAVGMATNIPPHRLGEVVDAVVTLIDKPTANVDDLMKLRQGPGLPDRRDRRRSLGHARRVPDRPRPDHHARARARRGAARRQERDHRHRAALRREEGRRLRRHQEDRRPREREGDDRDLRREGPLGQARACGSRSSSSARRSRRSPSTSSSSTRQLQTTFGYNAVALVDGVPRTLSLLELVRHYLDYQREIVTRRSKYELRKALERAHVLEGYLIALDNLDEVIALIRAPTTRTRRATELMARFELSEIQAQAILDLRLRAAHRPRAQAHRGRVRRPPGAHRRAPRAPR